MASAPSQAPGFVHVDLDGLWTLAGVYGYPEGDAFSNDPVFDIALPRLIALLDRHSIKAAFFIVGRDLELPAKRAAIASIASQGHELANHSYSHRLDLELMPEPDLDAEVARTNLAIELCSGEKPIGFRAPGYAAGPRILSACDRAGLKYDGSRLPTAWGAPLRFAAGRLRKRIGSACGTAAPGCDIASGPKSRDYSLAPKPPDSSSGPTGRDSIAQAEGPGTLTSTSQALTGRNKLGDVPTCSPAPSAHNSRGARLQYRDAVKPRCNPFAPSLWNAPLPAPAILRLPLAVSPTLRLPLHASIGFFLGADRVASALESLARRGHPVTWLLHGMDLLGIDDLRGRLPAPLLNGRAFSATVDAKLRFLQDVLPRFAAATRIQRTRDWLDPRESIHA